MSRHTDHHPHHSVFKFWSLLLACLLAQTALAKLAFAETGVLVDSDEFSLNVMTINAEWLWTPSDKQVDGSRFNKGDPPHVDYQKELSFYSRLVSENAVDVLAVQEIENELVAKELAGTLGSNWSYAFRQGRDTATGQDVALFFRIGVVVAVTDFDFPIGFLDGAQSSAKGKRLSKLVGMKLRLETASGKKTIGFITSHFLSKRNESPKKASKRLMQAQSLLKAAAKFKDLDGVVVLGDLNDYRYSPVVKTLESEGELLNASASCSGASKLETRDVQHDRRYLIDHILFRGFRCTDFDVLELKPFSDHPAIKARLVF